MQNILAVGLVVLVGAASCFMIIDRRTRSRGKDSREPGVPSVEVSLRIDREHAAIGPQTPVEPAESLSGAFKKASFSVRKPSRRSNSGNLQSIKTIHQLPRSEADFATAFERAASSSCLIVPAGNPLELSSFTPFVTGVHKFPAGQELPLPSIRRHVISIGLDLSRDDRHALPMLSDRLIASYLRDHFVSIQARIAKDPLTLELWLSPEPMAAMAKFQGASITENMEQAVLSSVKNFRSLGLLLKQGEQLRPKSLRTLVLVYTYLLAEPGSRASLHPRPQYELVFIRAREKDGHFELHSFVTSKSRGVLHYLGESRKPRRTTDCSIQATIYFSEYSHASLIPAKGVVRRSQVKSRSRFPLDKLKTFVRQRHWEGDVWDNVTEVLDNIIDGRLAS